MRDLYLLGIMLLYLGLGVRAPFVFGLGYIWTDYFSPQRVAFGFMSNVPASLIMALAAFVGYLFTRPEKRPQLTSGFWLLLVLAAWVTLTTTWSEVPSSAWATWNWSFKSVMFAAFLPYLFRTRVHLEAMLLTIAFGLSGTLMAFGAKTLLSGGHYNSEHALVGGNAGFAEGSTLACMAVAVVPIFLHMHRHSVIIKNRQISFCLFYGLSAASVITAVGTFERTGLVALAVLAVSMWWGARRKILLAGFFAVAVAGAGYLLSDQWYARMNTIQNYQTDVSAMTRLVVWRWCFDYAVDHPWGGGFNVWETSHISIPVGPDKFEEQTGRAPHSMYMQVLSEQGFAGELIFGAIILMFFINARRVYRRTKNDQRLDWANSLSKTIMISGAVYCAGGTFVGIAFQPYLYDLVAAGVILDTCIAGSGAGERDPSGSIKPLSPRAA